MRASGIPYRFIYLSIAASVVATSGCQSSRSDRTVRVTQASAPSNGPVEPVPGRLAGAASETETPASASDSTAMPASATASIDDAGELVRQANRLEASGMIGSEGGVDEAQLMAAFQHSDPRVREIAKRQYEATLARAQAGQSAATPVAASASGQVSTPSPQVSAPSPQATASTDAALDRAVPTLPGSAQRVAAAQPDAALPDAEANATGEVSQQPASGGPSVAEASATGSAGDMPAAESAERSSQPQARVASLAREANAAAPAADLDSKADSPDEKTPDESTEATDAADAGLDEQLAQLDDHRLFELLIDRYAEGDEDESEAAKLRRRINHRLLLAMAGRVDEAVEPLDGLTPSEQEYLRNQILAIWTAIDPQGHPVSQRRWSSALPHMREATSYLAAATGKLDVRSLAFCTEVVSYGRVKPFEVNRFAAGQEVILYSEVDCFAAERLSDGYETHFNGSFEIFDASGKRVADKVLPSDRQSGKNYRRDYFIAYRMHLPKHLAPGSYRLQLTIEDLKGQKYGSSSIEFDIEQTAGTE